jgi:hypothetical protein
VRTVGRDFLVGKKLEERRIDHLERSTKETQLARDKKSIKPKEERQTLKM